MVYETVDGLDVHADSITAAFLPSEMVLDLQEGDELWRLSTATGKEELVGKALSGDARMQSASMDGRETLWKRDPLDQVRSSIKACGRQERV